MIAIPFTEHLNYFPYKNNFYHEILCIYIISKDVPIEMIQIAINTLQSDSITPEEASIGYFTRRKLKKLSTWNEWKKGEHKQLDQFYDQKMFGDAIDPLSLPKNALK